MEPTVWIDPYIIKGKNTQQLYVFSYSVYTYSHTLILFIDGIFTIATMIDDLVKYQITSTKLINLRIYISSNNISSILLNFSILELNLIKYILY